MLNLRHSNPMEKSEEKTPCTTLNVLIIDDQKHDREIVKRSLMQTGQNINIHEVGDGLEAIKILKDKGNVFSCIFLDYLMPGTDGIKVMQEVSNGDPDALPAPIIMLTDHGDETVVIDAIQNGAQDYLSKDNISVATIKIAIAKAMKTYELKQTHRKAQEQLLQIQKLDALGQLTGGVAHDFNNLLTVILGNTRLLLKKNDVSESIKNRIELIDKTARKGADLVRRLMVFTQQRPIEAVVTDIDDIIRQVLTLLEHTIDSTIEIRTFFSSELLPAKIDINQLENALLNMAINARDAMPDGGTLTLETKKIILDKHYCDQYPNLRPGPYIMIAVSDTGTGMPKDIVQKIFDPFFTTKEVGKGTGLGLSTAYGFIKESGGDLHVYTEKNHGSVFRIYLPRADSSETDMNETLEYRYGNGETIVIVDDDKKLCDMIAIMMERMGYNPVLAKNSDDALVLINDKKNKADMLLADIFMQGDRNGIELAKKVREINPEASILLMTGFSETTLATYELLKDFEVISKPFFKDQLGSVIKSVLENRTTKAGVKKYGS